MTQRLAIWPEKNSNIRNYGLIVGEVDASNFFGNLVDLRKQERWVALRRKIYRIPGIVKIGDYWQFIIWKEDNLNWLAIEQAVIKAFQESFGVIDGIIYPEFAPDGKLTGYGTTKP